MDFDLRSGDRQGEHHDVERAVRQFIEQDLGLGLAQFDAKLGIAPLQGRQNLRQHIGRKRRDDAQRQRAGQNAAAMAGEIHQIARGREHLLAAPGDLQPDFSQHDLAGTPLDQLHPELLFEVLDLHRQRRLRHGTRLGGAAEMPEFGKRAQITQLLQRDHGDKIILSTTSGNTIRPDL